MIDLFVRTGEFAEAFLKQRANRPNTFFIGFCENQTEVTWVETVLKSSWTATCPVLSCLEAKGSRKRCRKT